MKLIIDVPEMTEKRLATLAEVLADQDVIRKHGPASGASMACQLGRENGTFSFYSCKIISAVQVEEAKHGDGFGGTVPVWRQA